MDDQIRNRIRFLREKTDFLGAVFDHLVGLAVIAADFDGNVLAYNEGSRLIYGYAPSEVIGQETIDIFYTDEDKKNGFWQNIISDLINKGGISYEGKKVRKNGEIFPASTIMTIARDKPGNMVGFVEIVKDLAEQKSVEEAIRNLNEDLERRITERVAQLKGINRMLRESHPCYGVEEVARVCLTITQEISGSQLEKYK